MLTINYIKEHKEKVIGVHQDLYFEVTSGAWSAGRGAREHPALGSLRVTWSAHSLR